MIIVEYHVTQVLEGELVFAFWCCDIFHRRSIQLSEENTQRDKRPLRHELHYQSKESDHDIFDEALLFADDR
jgi:hypothetical protein